MENQDDEIRFVHHSFVKVLEGLKENEIYIKAYIKRESIPVAERKEMVSEINDLLDGLGVYLKQVIPFIETETEFVNLTEALNAEYAAIAETRVRLEKLQKQNDSLSAEIAETRAKLQKQNDSLSAEIAETRAKRERLRKIVVTRRGAPIARAPPTEGANEAVASGNKKAKKEKGIVRKDRTPQHDSRRATQGTDIKDTSRIC